MLLGMEKKGVSITLKLEQHPRSVLGSAAFQLGKPLLKYGKLLYIFRKLKPIIFQVL